MLLLFLIFVFGVGVRHHPCDTSHILPLLFTGSFSFAPTKATGDESMEVVSRKPLPFPSELDNFTQLLTVEDARVMVDLLKLAVANRVGEKGKETLAAVLTAMGKASPLVRVFSLK